MANEEQREHPAIDALVDYLEAPDAPQQAALRRHLADCPACRREAAAAALLREQAPWIESPETEPDPRLAALLAGRLDGAAARALRAELEADPERKRAALHFAGHALAMDSARPAAAPPPPAAAWRTRLLRWLRADIPAWRLAAPLAAALLVAIWLAPAPWSDDDWQVIAFEQPGELRFVGREAQPGIGFFSTGGPALPYAGVQVEIPEEGRLRLSWPAIDGANGYNLRLKVFRDGAARAIAGRRVEGNEVELEIDPWLPRHRYQWELSGETAERGAFIASGEFIINRPASTP